MLLRRCMELDDPEMPWATALRDLLEDESHDQFANWMSQGESLSNALEALVSMILAHQVSQVAVAAGVGRWATGPRMVGLGRGPDAH